MTFKLDRDNVKVNPHAKHVLCHLIAITTTTTVYGHYTGQPALACTSSEELENFVGAKFYSPHASAFG